MQIDATISDFVNWLADVTRAQVQESNGNYVFSLRMRGIESNNEPDSLVSISSAEAQSIIQRLEKKKVQEGDIAIYDSRSYEILIREESLVPRPSRLLTSDSFSLRDNENNLTYSIAKPTDEYLLYLLYKVSQTAAVRLLSVFSYRLQRLSEEGGLQNLSILDAAKYSIPRLLTLRIESGRDRKFTDFTKFADALFFHLSYNLDSAFLPQRNFEELLRRGRILRLRRTKPDDLEAPKRTYLSPLVYHYQLAIATESPLLQYLSFYHILENFYETVFNKDLIDNIRGIITDTGFSTKRDNDIKRLIKHINSSLQFRGDNVIFNEQEALKLTIDKYLKAIPDLISKIRAYDESLIEYYQTNTVSFSDGDCVDLQNIDRSQIIASLSRRIYRTRNAIVHSKEGEQSKYIPFQHDSLLAKELPLLRFVAESIMIETSSYIE